MCMYVCVFVCVCVRVGVILKIFFKPHRCTPFYMFVMYQPKPPVIKHILVVISI